jgi:hypothetical protein
MCPFNMRTRTKRASVSHPLHVARRQHRALLTGGSGFAPPVVHRTLHSSSQALDAETRAALEPRFGHNFSSVRVHTDAQAAESARAVGALAYTVGCDIVFDNGYYAPRSAEGQHLLAHELTHVVQQSAHPPTDSIRLGDPDSPAEIEAQAAAQSRGTPSVETGISPSVLQRAPQKKGDARQGPWSANKYITAGVGYFDDAWWSTVDAEGHYDTSDDSDRPFSQVFTGQLCVGEPLPLNFAFHVDTYNTPRPKPFPHSRASITLNFLTDKGKMIPVKNLTSTTQYLTPGLGLLTAFGLSVPFSPPEPGKLLVSLTHSDPALGELVIYSDEIPVTNCPGKEQQKDDARPAVIPDPENKPQKDDARPTHYTAVIPDPENKPLDYHLLTPQDGLDQPGVITPIEEDTWGHFYRIKGKKYYIEDPSKVSARSSQS